MRHLVFLASALAVSSTYVPGKAFNRFITIWLENEDFSNVEQNADVESLKKQGVLLTEYFGLTHPSQPNYIASVGGDYFGLDHDGLVTIPSNVSTIVDLFDTRHIDWRGYFEGMPGPGYMAGGSTKSDGQGYDYVRKHNPFASYESISHNGSRLAKLVSFDEFARDVEANTLPQYMHLSPDMLNDGHNTSLEYAMNWTTSFLKPLLSNADFMNQTLILLTYDESETYNKPNRIASLLLGGAVPQDLRGTTDSTFYTHYSILSTLESNWDLPCLGRYDVGANVFSFVASQTSYRNNLAVDLDAVNNSISNGGFLHSDPAMYLPIPPPNLQLLGAGGKGVAPSVMKGWSKASAEKTPYDGSGILHDIGNGKSAPQKSVYKAQGSNTIFTPTSTGSVATASSTRSFAGRLTLSWRSIFAFGVLGISIDMVMGL